MLKRFSKVIVGMLVLSMFFSMNTISASAQTGAGSAAEYVPVSVNFVYISSFKNSFDISSSGLVSITSKASAYDIDEMHVSGLLQQYVNGQWKTIKTWYMETSGTNDILSGTCYVASGYDYRYMSYANMYADGVFVESTSYTSSAIHY